MLGVTAGCIIGILLGTVSGVIPDIHSNTIAGFLTGVFGPLLLLIDQDGLAAAIVATMVTHTFLDAVPSTFLGIPDPDTVFAVLPAHRMCLASHGEEASFGRRLWEVRWVLFSVCRCSFCLWLFFLRCRSTSTGVLDR